MRRLVQGCLVACLGYFALTILCLMLPRIGGYWAGVCQWLLSVIGVSVAIYAATNRRYLFGPRSRRLGYRLLDAAARGDVKAVDRLIHRGADLTLATDPGGGRKHAAHEAGRTALHLAARRGNSEMMKLLLQNGADVNSRDNCSSTPLHDFAASHPVGDPTALLNLLISHGADINATDLGGETPLHRAMSHGSLGVVDCLLDHGADPYAGDRFGRTPISLAALEGHVSTLEHLASRGYSIPEAEMTRAKKKAFVKELDARRTEEAKAERNSRIEEAARYVGTCAVCGRPVHRNERYYGHVDSGFDTSPGHTAVPYTRTHGVYHKACAERAGVV